MDKKRKAFRFFKSEGMETSYQNYKECNKKCKRAIKLAKMDNDKRIEIESKVNPKMLFKYLNNKKMRKESGGPFQFEMGRQIIGDKEKAEVLNKFFASVYTRKK